MSNNKWNFRSYLASQSFLSTAQPYNLVRRSHAEGESAVSCRCFLSHMISFNPRRPSEVNIIVLISTKRGSDLSDFTDLDRDQADSRFSVEWKIVRGQARHPRLLEDSKSKCVSLPEKSADVVLAKLYSSAESSSKWWPALMDCRGSELLWTGAPFILLNIIFVSRDPSLLPKL